MVFQWNLSCLAEYVESGEGDWEESLREVLELNFLFRRTNYAQLLRSLDTKGVSRSASRKLIDHARCEEVLRFVRWHGVESVPSSLIESLPCRSFRGHMSKSDSASSFHIAG